LDARLTLLRKIKNTVVKPKEVKAGWLSDKSSKEGCGSKNGSFADDNDDERVKIR
jgi:hypothetical protein